MVLARTSEVRHWAVWMACAWLRRRWWRRIGGAGEGGAESGDRGGRAARGAGHALAVVPRVVRHVGGPHLEQRVQHGRQLRQRRKQRALVVQQDAPQAGQPVELRQPFQRHGVVEGEVDGCQPGAALRDRGQRARGLHVGALLRREAALEAQVLQLRRHARRQEGVELRVVDVQRGERREVPQVRQAVAQELVVRVVPERQAGQAGQAAQVHQPAALELRVLARVLRGHLQVREPREAAQRLQRAVAHALPRLQRQRRQARQRDG
mmetsp:Transcript_21137/g.53187  ORF Transcript_21137/g.53187 Transcript_21137/m.53187 type:complete len:265 (-) Transcript_21137:153-947(-)